MGNFRTSGHERVRKGDDIALYRGSRAAERRSYRDQRPSHVQRSPAGLRPGRTAQDRHGVSIVRDLAAHDRVPERQPSVAGIERRAIEQKVNDALDLVGLRTMGLHSATQLSGGQQQRVALARCMRTEIRNLQRRLARMILFVKAMSTADTIYLLSDGKVLQKGRPKEIYENPRTRYAAEFLGRANISSIDSSGPQLGRVLHSPGCPRPAGPRRHSRQGGFCAYGRRNGASRLIPATRSPAGSSKRATLESGSNSSPTHRLAASPWSK
jgi:ABC-type glutathione transport system ATPase component